MDYLKNCTLCPRKCNINRYERPGFCGADNGIRVARAALHFMEEPCISGKEGSGTIFFSGCNLKCCYCQNYKISHENFGINITEYDLAEIMMDLQSKGANNINLVTGVMFVPHIIRAIDIIRDRLVIPVVYNTSGYENPETIKMLKGYVDIYLTDIKYFDDEAAIKYSKAPGYFINCMEAVREMIKQTGKPVFKDNKNFDDETALLQSGVIIRHLVLPGGRKDSIRILNELAGNFSKDEYILSLMSQFTPNYKCGDYKEINRKITGFEYDSVVNKALELGLHNTYIQDRKSAGLEYTPPFNLEGVIIDERNDDYGKKKCMEEL